MARFVAILFMLMLNLVLCFSEFLQDQSRNFMKTFSLEKTTAFEKQQMSRVDFTEENRRLRNEIGNIKNLLLNEVEKRNHWKINKHEADINNVQNDFKEKIKNKKRRRGRRHSGKRKKTSKRKSSRRRANRSKKRMTSTQRMMRQLPRNSVYTLSIGSGRRIIILPLFSARGGNRSFNSDSSIFQLALPSERLLQAFFEVFVSVKTEKVGKTRNFPKRHHRNLEVVTNLIKRQKSGKDMILARGKLREDRPLRNRRIGSNRSGRTRFSVKLLKYQFVITNLFPQSHDEANNFTEQSKYRKLSEWKLPKFDLVMTCVRSDVRRPVPCPRNAVKLTEARLVLKTLRES